MVNAGEQTVTVYRRVGQEVTRRVFTGCHYAHTTRLVRHERFERMERTFLLILPGLVDIAIGDRVLEGNGPQQVDWDSFLPVAVPGLSEVAWTRQYAHPGAGAHTEAGRDR